MATSKKEYDLLSQFKVEIDRAAEQAVRAIASAAGEAKTLIASSALDASKVVSTNAAEASKILHLNTAGDHDLIVTLGVKMDGVQTSIKELNEGTGKRIGNLEHDKLNLADSYPVLYKKDVDDILADHTEKLQWQRDKIISVMAWGGLILFIISVAEPFILKFWK